MDKIFSYNFLKLEFRDIYEDIEELKKNEANNDIEKSISTVIGDIIYCIYKKNSILYDKEAPWKKQLEILKDINKIPSEIVEKILLWSKELKEDYLSNLNNKSKNLYEVLVWFVINYGDENYSLVLDNLTDVERDIFNKYLDNNKSINQIESKENKGKSEEIQDQDNRVRQLVEKGENYYFGKGVKKDTKKAYKFFLEAAKLKDEYAETYLGLFYDRGIGVTRNYEIAYQWYYKAASKGNAFAQYSLGVLYSEGNGVIKDHNKAFLWFQKSAENDYVASYYQLGRYYYSGLGVDKDDEKAFKWYKKGADNNLPSSQYALALMYKNGEGCEKNLISAYYWMEKAAENDYEDAYYIIGKSYLEGIVVEANYKKAFHYLSKGYLSLDTNCIESLAEMYLKGLYVKKDIYTALELYNKAIEFGDKSIYFRLGKVYEDEGLSTQAILIYKQGHEEGNLKCTQRLGVIYYNGEGTEKDLEKAVEYMEMAAAKKEPHAMYVLAVAYYRINKFGDKTDNIVKTLLKEAYELGSPYAGDYLACIMINELKEGKDINKNELLSYIKFGVENNLNESIYKYGYIYEKGIAVEQNYEQAYQYYTRAAKANYVKAMIKLADWYKTGIFLARNIDLAINWYENAAKEENIEAIEKLIEIYEKGIGGKRSDIKAIYYVFKLIDLDALKGKEKLIYYCFKGIGIEENKEKGYELLNEIKDIDEGMEKYIRGYLAEKKLLDINKDEIIKLYQDGIELGNLQCYGELAHYLYRNGMDKNPKYKEIFEVAMEGKKLGLNKCEYIFLKDKLNEVQKSGIVTVEELVIIKKLSKLINKGIYEVINDLIEWYNKRNPQDKMIYYSLKQESIYYNIEKES